MFTLNFKIPVKKRTVKNYWQCCCCPKVKLFLKIFLSECIVRRELAENFCFYQPDYDNLKGGKYDFKYFNKFFMLRSRIDSIIHRFLDRSLM